MVKSDSSIQAELDRFIQGAQLPALPQSAIRILELSRDPKNGPAEFALPIEADPGLTGQVLRFVNSSYFGFAREISNVKLAITLVGIRTIKNFALWSAVFSLMPNPKCGPFDLKSLWCDSLRRGIFARSFGKMLGLKDAEELFAAALLQDMAVPLLAKEKPDLYLSLLDQRSDGKVRLSQLEREQFGWTHADAAARMAEHWNLPAGFATLIKGHSQGETLFEQDDADPAELAVAVSALLPASRDGTWTEASQFETIYNRFRGDSDPTVGEMLAKVDEDFKEFAPILKVGTQGSTLVEAYERATAQAP